jgi:hypothetical protein
VAAVIVVGGGAAPADSFVLLPPKHKIFFGVTDRGSVVEYQEFRDVVEKHPAILETFHPWGNSLHQALPRWQNTHTRPMLHISTADDETGAEILTPRAIARGAGDKYLLRLNRTFGAAHLPAYIRPLGEPNRCLNPYSAFYCDGSARGSAHRQRWYKQAFRRMAILLRGGGSREEINARLARIHLQPLEGYGFDTRRLPAAPISIVWSPLPAGSPRRRGNYPRNYWPGTRYVDWVGTDFYSEYPHWKALNRFFTRPFVRRKPFALTEWAVAGRDDPGFIRRIFRWVRRHSRVRMLIYYRGFGEAGNKYRIGLYPRSLAVLQRKLDSPRFPPLAPNHADPPPTPAPEGGGVGN